MIICLNDIYFETLEKYVGKKLDIIKGENTIKFYDDVEIQYILEEKDKIYSFYIVERGKRSKLADYFSEREMKNLLSQNVSWLDHWPFSRQTTMFDLSGTCLKPLLHEYATLLCSANLECLPKIGLALGMPGGGPQSPRKKRAGVKLKLARSFLSPDLEQEKQQWLLPSCQG